MKFARTRASRLARQVAFCVGGSAIFATPSHWARAYSFDEMPSFVSQVQAEQEGLLQNSTARTELGAGRLFSEVQAEGAGLFQNPTVHAELGTGDLYSQLEAEQDGLGQNSSGRVEVATGALDLAVYSDGARKTGPMNPRVSGGEDPWQSGRFGDMHFHMPRDGWIESKWGVGGRHPFCFAECGGVVSPSAVPEPGKLLLSLTGVLMILFAVRRRQRKLATD